MLAPHQLGELLDQQGDVVRPLAQRRMQRWATLSR
jgi:hypothetical protein